MGKRLSRPQTQKDANLSRVHRVQELRRSSASEPVPSRARYNRNAHRKNAQRGNWEV
jgi:hypothetical protein